MPYVLPFVKVNVLGHFGNTSTTIGEHWQCGFHLTKNGGLSPDTATITTFLAAISGPTGTLHGNATLAAGNKCWLTGLNGASIGTDGKYVLGSLQPTSTYTFGTPVAGGGTGGGPWSAALVFTLRSLFLRGPASHGRIYYPATGLLVDPATGTLAAAQTALIKAGVLTWANAVNTAAAAAFGSGVTMGLVSNVGSGAQSPVVQIGIGQRMDSMESRERSIPESYNNVVPTVAAALIAERDRKLREGLEEYLEDFADVDDR